ncbi:MAG: hypothetical protein QXM52_04110 [Candidatus Bathyarchaeia archaeon]
MTLLISSILIATASATAYVTLQWTATATVSANPKVCFIKWQDETKANTFNYDVNIFPSITTVDENITYGIYNWDTQAHNVSIRWSSLTNSGNIASLNLTIYNSTHTVYTKVWSSVPSLPTGWEDFTYDPMANGKYTIAMRITAASGASGSSTFTFEIKVKNP